MSQRMNHNAVSPAGMKALGAVYGYVRQSGLPSRLSIWCICASPRSTGAPIASTHIRATSSRPDAVEHLVLLAAWPEAGKIFDEQEKAALAWAEAVTRLGERGVPDSAYDAAAAAFDEKQLADLTIAIGLMNAYNRMAISFRATPMAVAAVLGK